MATAILIVSFVVVLWWFSRMSTPKSKRKPLGRMSADDHVMGILGGIFGMSRLRDGRHEDRCSVDPDLRPTARPRPRLPGYHQPLADPEPPEAHDPGDERPRNSGPGAT